MSVAGRFYSGTSNVVIPLKQSQFPPQFAGVSRLTYYASLFSSVEVNATFYKLPKMATIGKWRDSVPEDFRFTFKVPKTITHAKGLQFNSEDVELFVETADKVGDKKGCLLVQLPPKISRDHEEELTALLECLRDNTREWKIAVEFRHPSWYDRSIYRVLEHYGIVMVEHDMPKAATPKIERKESFVYLRFHGPEGGYRGSYEDETLKGYAQRIAQWMNEGKEVFVYFNNTMGEALKNLQTLNEMVKNIEQGIRNKE